MQMRVRVGVVAVMLLGAFGLTGCVQDAVIPTLPPTPSSGAIFASEEEALAAAEAAYAAYLEMSNLISSEGGEDPERIAPLVTERRLVDELRGFESYRDLGIRTTGIDTFEVVELQRFEDSGASAEVVFYACWDTSEVRVIDSSGDDVTPTDREKRQVLEVVMVSESGGLPLVLDSDSSWPASSC